MSLRDLGARDLTIPGQWIGPIGDPTLRRDVGDKCHRFRDSGTCGIVGLEGDQDVVRGVGRQAKHSARDSAGAAVGRQVLRLDDQAGSQIGRTRIVPAGTSGDDQENGHGKRHTRFDPTLYLPVHVESPALTAAGFA
jgi:hypothetical protein